MNFVGRTDSNNGVQGKISLRDFAPNEPNTLTVTVIGNYKYVKYQELPYYCSQNINKFKPKNSIKWNKKIAYYFCSNIYKFIEQYNGQQGGYKLDEIRNHLIQLPTKNGEIDFEFMEIFIDSLEKERIKKLDTYLKVSGLQDYHLTDEETTVLENYYNLKFKEFKVVDIFNVRNAGSILSRDIVKGSGQIPYLCASSENNGVSSYIEYDSDFIDKGNCVFIGGKTFVVSYQKEDFFSNDSHNLSLYLKEEAKKNKSNQLFLCCCINKSLGHKYSWGNSISNRKIQTDIVNLPINDNNEIDYKTMELLISAIQKQIIKGVVNYTKEKLN